MLEFSRHEKVLVLLLPHGRCCMFLHLLNSFCAAQSSCSSFPGMRRFWLFCCLMADAICSCIYLIHFMSHFARVFPASEAFGYFVTSWPMLYAATFIKFLLSSPFRSSFPGIRSFGYFVTSWPVLSLARLHLFKFLL